MRTDTEGTQSFMLLVQSVPKAPKPPLPPQPSGDLVPYVQYPCHRYSYSCPRPWLADHHWIPRRRVTALAKAPEKMIVTRRRAKPQAPTDRGTKLIPAPPRIQRLEEVLPSVVITDLSNKVAQPISLSFPPQT